MQNIARCHNTTTRNSWAYTNELLGVRPRVLVDYVRMLSVLSEFWNTRNLSKLSRAEKAQFVLSLKVAVFSKLFVLSAFTNGCWSRHSKRQIHMVKLPIAADLSIGKSAQLTRISAVNPAQNCQQIFQGWWYVRQNNGEANEVAERKFWGITNILYIGRDNPPGCRDLDIHAARRSGEPDVTSRALHSVTTRQHVMPKNTQINCLRSGQQFRFTTCLK